MTSQYQRSDLVDDLALFEERPIAEAGDAVSGHGMTVAGLLAFYCVADPLSRSDGPPSTEEFDAFLTGAERLFRFSADSLESAKFFEAVILSSILFVYK